MAKRGKTKVTRSMINQEITRIRNIVREAEKQGYVFGDVIPKNVNVTKSQLSKLRSVTREKLLSTARRVDENGVILPTKAEKNRELRQQQKQKKRYIREQKRTQKLIRKQSSLVTHQHEPQENIMSYEDWYIASYENFIRTISRFDSSVYQALADILSRFEQQVGKERIAIALEDMPEGFYQVLQENAYDSDSAPTDFASRLLNYIPKIGQQEKEILSDVIEEYGTNVETY